MAGGRKGKSARPRGRPQKTAAIRLAQDLRAHGRTLRQIAESNHLRFVLGTRVTRPGVHQHVLRKRITPQGVHYLLRQTPRGRDRWQQDLDVAAAWCRGLGMCGHRAPHAGEPCPEVVEFNAFWHEVVFPLLLAHPDTFRGRSEQAEQSFTGWTVTEIVTKPVAEPATETMAKPVEARLVVRTRVKRTSLSKTSWWARHHDLEMIERRARGWSGPRAWRRAVRQTLLWYGWERSVGQPMWRRLSDLGERFSLSARQVRRIVMRRDGPSDEIPRTRRAGRRRSEPGGEGGASP